MEETRRSSLVSLLGEYRSVLQSTLAFQANPCSVIPDGITNIYTTISNSFWGCYLPPNSAFADSRSQLTWQFVQLSCRLLFS